MFYISGNELKTSNFSSGELKASFPVIAKGEEITVIWRYESDAELFTLICIAKHYQNHKKYLYLPYLPNARMDRVKNLEDVFTLKYFCQIINSLNFEVVYVTDVHSNVSLALLDRVSEITPKSYIEFVINTHEKEDLVLVYPDAGAAKRYSEMFPEYDSTYCDKVRDWKTQKITSLVLNDPNIVSGKSVLIVDDICSYGNTFVRAAEALKAANAAKIYLYVTHAENAIVKGDIFKSGLIDKVYATGSLVHTDEVKEKITELF